MRGANNKKFVFWLIGLGCGMTLSGIMMMILVLNIKEYQQDLVNHFTSSEQKQTTDSLNNDPVSSSEPVETSDNLANNTTEPQDANEEPKSEVVLEEVKKPETITLFIPKDASALRICELLQKEEIISDAQDFSKYIVANKKTKYLKDGEIVFPIGATYEVLLNILVVN